MPMVVTSSIYSNFVRFPSLHLHLITNKPALFGATNKNRRRQRCERRDMGGGLD